MNNYSVNLQFVPLDSVRLLLILAAVVGIFMGGALFWLVKDIGEMHGLSNKWFDRFEWKFSALEAHISNLDDSVEELTGKLEEKKADEDNRSM